MEEIQKADIIGEMISCPRLGNAAIGGGVIYLEKCVKCKFHSGIELVRPKNEKEGQLEINNVICSLPTQIRIIYHLGGPGE